MAEATKLAARCQPRNVSEGAIIFWAHRTAFPVKKSFPTLSRDDFLIKPRARVQNSREFRITISLFTATYSRVFHSLECRYIPRYLLLPHGCGGCYCGI